mmetsp:Transcript_24053/g.60986  ORF Transcript_24053/g.60986 Transcript_24053/m.60986 type:complete len:98 (+) Transcript_24053:661-954(+)
MRTQCRLCIAEVSGVSGKRREAKEAVQNSGGGCLLCSHQVFEANSCDGWPRAPLGGWQNGTNEGRERKEERRQGSDPTDEFQKCILVSVVKEEVPIE